MKKFVILVFILSIFGVFVVLVQVVCVGMVYDVGGKVDKSFNQSVYEGSQFVVKKFGIQVKDFEFSDFSQIIQGVCFFVKEGFDLIIGVGFFNNVSIIQVVKENFDLYFGLVDDVSIVKNVVSLVFNEEQGSYFVGYFVVMNFLMGVVGFIGGMNILLIYKFEVGYCVGVKVVNFKVIIILQYVGNIFEVWNNFGKVKEIVVNMCGCGVDIIFVVVGGFGNGLIDYIKQIFCFNVFQFFKGVIFKFDNFKNVKKSVVYVKVCMGNICLMFFIGVDSNQNYFGDFDKNFVIFNYGLISMVKWVDNVVYVLINEVKNDKFKVGECCFGFKDGGVVYVVDQYNKVLLFVVQIVKVEVVKQQIIKGQIKVLIK